MAFDLIVVSGNPKTLTPIWNESKELGISPEKNCLGQNNLYPRLFIGKLSRSRLSILSKNCFGGLLFSILGLRYNSPTVNMLADSEEQFLELLQAPIENLKSEPKFMRMDNNLLVAMNTERPEIAAEFDKLPYAKKICLTNFHSDLDSAFYLPMASKDFNNIAVLSYNTPRFYNIWDMLLYGKKTPLF